MANGYADVKTLLGQIAEAEQAGAERDAAIAERDAAREETQQLHASRLALEQVIVELKGQLSDLA